MRGFCPPLPNMGEVAINAQQFCSRLKRFKEGWLANQAGPWSGANALAIAVGTSSEDLRYLKSISLHLWLFGYELPGEPLRLLRGLGCTLNCLCARRSLRRPCRHHHGADKDGAVGHDKPEEGWVVQAIGPHNTALGLG